MKFKEIKIENVARNIRMKRAAYQWNLRELSLKSGVNICTLSKIENAEGNPLLSTVADLAEAFDCSVEDLLY